MAGGFETDEVYQIETNIDDCSAEVLGLTMEHLLAAGALESPGLLLRSGIGGPVAGMHLRLHPCTIVFADYGTDQQ